MKKEKRGAAKRVSDSMDLPVSVLSREPQVYICGRDTVEIDGCLGILSYTDDSLELNMGDYSLRVQGRDITLSSLSKGLIKAEGKLEGVLIKNRDNEL